MSDDGPPLLLGLLEALPDPQPTKRPDKPFLEGALDVLTGAPQKTQPNEVDITGGAIVSLLNDSRPPPAVGEPIRGGPPPSGYPPYKEVTTGNNRVDTIMPHNTQQTARK